tara:strand:+ start:2980 stop:5070 length:2091 start_codon:yes stop_codon:yes gene_type:complete
MILQSIKLKNIRSYYEQEIVFPKGITLFEGDIGSGKSSILMAIEFALFGTGSQKGDTLLSKKTNEGTVELKFEVDGTDYEIKRELKRTAKSVNQNAKNCHLRIGDEVFPFSPGELKQEILNILKFNEPASPNAQSKIYRYAIFTPQEEMKQILVDSEKRLETIRRAFGVEDYKKARDNAERIAHSISTKLAVLKDRIQDIEEKKDSLKKWESRVEEIKKESEINKKESEKLKKDLDRKREEKDEIEKKNSEKDKAINEKKQTEIKLEIKIDQIKEYSESIQEIIDDIGEKDSEITQIKDAKSPSKLTKIEIDEIINRIEKFNNEKIVYGTKKEKFEEDITQLQKLGTECVYCHQKITKEHQAKMSEERKNEISKIESKLREIDDKIINILKDVEVDKNDEPNIMIRKLVDLKNDLKVFDNSKETIMQLEEAQEKRHVKLKEKEQVQRVVQSETEKLKNHLIEISNRIESLPNFDKEILMIKDEEDAIQKEFSECVRESGQIEQELRHADTQSKLWEKNVKETENWKKDQEKLVDYHTWIKEFFIPSTNQIEKQVLITIQQNFNETYRRWFKILIEDNSKDSWLAEDFTPILEQDGFEQNFYNLSGGEKTSVSLAYRLSLNTMMRENTESLKSNLLILDEPTDGFSKNQLVKVKDVLHELNSEQIILVSHERELETYADNIFQISKSEGYSKVSRLN